jgi:3-methyl-2-oxobutanoate hydroxymethyltransferase
MSSHTSLNDAAAVAARKSVTLPALRAMQERGEKIAMLTAYDATFARLLDDCGVDVVLVGDSLGNVMQGQASTLQVTLEDMVYHTQCVARGVRSAWLIADLPFGSYHEGVEQAVRSSVALMRAGAHMVKLEGGEPWAVEAVAALVQRGIPVCAHLGFTPQSKYALGGNRVQGRDEDGAALLTQRAAALAEAGAAMLVLEMVPATLAQQIQQANPQLMTIGIGAGPDTAGQVLVLHDMLGATRGKLPRFVRNFLQDAPGLEAAIKAYVAAVKDKSFPDPAVHTY